MSITLISKLLNNKVLSGKLIENSLIEVIISSLPGKHSSLHLNKITNHDLSIRNVSIYVIKVFGFIGKYLLKSNRSYITQSHRFDFLILVPNSKFLSHYEVIKKEIQGDTLILSLSGQYMPEGICLKSFLPNRITTVAKFAICLITYSIYAYRNKKEFYLLLNNLDLAQKFIYNILIFNDFFQIYTFKKYFSLLPNIDQHYLIEEFYSEQFQKTFAIRATATAYAKEHSFIRTQTLFYKSLLEKEIYDDLLIDKDIKLKEASILFKQENKPKTRQNTEVPRKLLFLDTCLSKTESRNISRLSAISSFYRYFENENSTCNIYHKFHPALNKNYRNEIMTKYQNVSYIFDTDEQSLLQFDLIIGFYSTLFQYAILNEVPIIMLSNNFNNNLREPSYIKADVEQLPIRSIQTDNELITAFDTIFSDQFPLRKYLKTQALKEELQELYNYPYGLKNMFKELNS